MTPEDLIAIPGGVFLMGQADGRDEERPVHEVCVPPFRLCRFQVTNADYARFRTISYEHGMLPITSVNWFDATEFCAWLWGEWGMEVRLPTEAEWEFAARGGREQQRFPWGDEPPETRQNYHRRWLAGPEVVATAEPNGYGLYDMCENVHEWCSDW
jgi:sulfatase modifying factor 1